MQYFYECLILNLKSPTKNIFTYHYNTPLNIGDLVEVNLRNKTYKAIVHHKTPSRPAYKTKPIHEFIYPQFLQEWQIKLNTYISQYYFCNPSTSIHGFIPKKIFDTKFDLSEIEQPSFQIPAPKHELNQQQADILQKISTNQNKIHLLHGITGSGKTEVYLQYIIQKLKQDSTAQTLLLVPEISLTPQITNYFLSIFPEESIAVFHSKLNKTEKLNEWKKVKSGQTKVVIGSRSSLFLPFKNLQTVIMDEEHDSSYKQDQDPKYHARNILQWLNQNLKTTCILGSATPSLETYNAAQKENSPIQYHHLNQKAKAKHDIQYSVIDLKNERKGGNFHFLSNFLADQIKQTIRNKQQVLLLHNRRGTANYQQCFDCGEIVQCKNCSISMTPHGNMLKCHYCDHSEPTPHECPKCGSPEIRNKGVGVQKIEAEIQDLFPDANILRIDSDTNSRKNAHTENYEKLKQGDADIIIGTQIIATGLDIENISLVGIINADQHLNFPDFRAHERTIQLLTQFAGRTGRGQHQGHVVIQTYQPENPIIQNLTQNQLQEFYKQELKIRQIFNYPPFSRTTKLTFSHKDKVKVQQEAKILEQQLTSLKITDFKSSPPLIERKHNKYYHQILINTLIPQKIIPHLQLQKGWSIDRDTINTV